MRRDHARTGTLRAPWTSQRWCAYFRANAGNLLTLPWQCGAEWTEEEKAVLAPSLQDFQLGESSEGRNVTLPDLALATTIERPETTLTRERGSQWRF